MKNINLAFRGGNSKGLAYLRLIKEIDILGGFKAGVISGSSIGGVTAAAIACQYSEPQFAVALSRFPGQNVMQWDVKTESGNIFYAIPTAIGAWKLTEKLEAYYKQYFNWYMVPKEVELYITFALEQEIGNVAGLHRFTYLDLYKTLMNKDLDLQIGCIHPYYAGRNGIYTYNYRTKQIEKVSNSVIPLERLVFYTMCNPLFKPQYVKELAHPFMPYKELTAFDGGIADNHASCIHTKPFIQLNCCSKEEDKPEGSLSDFYDKNKAIQPISTHYLEPVEEGKAFFDFRPRTIVKEDAVPATTILTKHISSIIG